MLFADLVTEFIGTFFLVAVIIATSGQAIAAGIALAGAIFLAGQNKSAHFNPSVTISMLMRGDLSWQRCAKLLCGQVLAAAAAVAFTRWVQIKPTQKPK
jgi:glycerol uptake facilitator-like aquaporin